MLQKQLSLFSLIMIAVGSSIGSGIFRTPAEIAGYLPAAGWILAIWGLGAVVSLCGALTFAELAARYPQAGGFYVFLKAAYGPLPAFLFGWSMLLVINTGSLAALSLVFAGYVQTALGWSANWQVPIGVGAIAALTGLNIAGVKWGGWFAILFTLAKLSGIVLITVVGLGWGQEDLQPFDFSWEPTDHATGWLAATGLALIGVTFSYGGYHHATFVAAEVKDGARQVPRAMTIGIGIVALAYLLINLAYLKLLPLSRIAGAEGVAALAITQIWPWGAQLVAFLIVLSVLGTIGIYILTAPRIYYAMAADGLFFKQFARVHPQYHTPQWAILIQSLWTLVLLVFWQTFVNLITYVVFVDALFFFLTATTVFFLRQKERPAVPMPWYPLPPLLFLAFQGFIIVNTLVTRSQEALAGLFFLGLGALAYVFFAKTKKHEGAHLSR